MKKIAIVPGRGLGDGLIWLTLSYHLQLVGHEVTTFNTHLCQLKKWFPGQNLSPLPQIQQEHSIFDPYAQIIAADHSILSHEKKSDEKFLILQTRDFNRKKTYVENLFDYCRKEHELTFHSTQNGMKPKKELQYRKHLNRIVIHPTCADPLRSWPKKKFLNLAFSLKKKGFHPVFAMSLEEREKWNEVKAFEIPSFSSLDETASYLYESGFFIGNDSGLGHLASNLQIPSISLFARRSHSHLWRPGWGLNEVVTPLPLMIGAPLKQKYWRELLPVWKVMRKVNIWEKELIPSPK